MFVWACGMYSKKKGTLSVIKSTGLKLQGQVQQYILGVLKQEHLEILA